MKIRAIWHLAHKKAHANTKRLLVTIIPTSLVLGVFIALSIYAHGIVSSLERQMITPMRESLKFVFISKNTQISSERDGGYTEQDVKSISAIENIDSAFLPTKSLFSDAYSGSLHLNNITPNETPIAIEKLQGIPKDNQTFFGPSLIYKEGQPIPIVIPASKLVTDEIDFKEKKSISIDTSSAVPTIKKAYAERVQKDLAENKKVSCELTFTTKPIHPDYYLSSAENDKNAQTIIKYTKDELKQDNERMILFYQKYFDTSSLFKDITYPCVIVGITNIEDSSIYVPSEFIEVMDEEFLNTVSKAIKKSDHLSEMLDYGLRGTMIENNQIVKLSEESKYIESSVKGQTFPTQEIAGFLYEKSGADYRLLSGIPKISSINKGARILIRINDINMRKKVFQSLKSIGFQVVDNNFTSMMTHTFDLVQTGIRGLMWIFILCITIILTGTLMKEITDAQTEIGVYRALGMNTSSLILIFTFQLLHYLIYTIGIALILSVVVVLTTRGVLIKELRPFILNTFQNPYIPFPPTVNATDILLPDFTLLGEGALFLLTVLSLFCILPFSKISKISPIQAIKNNI